jgi:hypothetical protein
LTTFRNLFQIAGAYDTYDKRNTKTTSESSEHPGEDPIAAK